MQYDDFESNLNFSSKCMCGHEQSCHRKNKYSCQADNCLCTKFVNDEKNDYEKYYDEEIADKPSENKDENEVNEEIADKPSENKDENEVNEVIKND